MAASTVDSGGVVSGANCVRGGMSLAQHLADLKRHSENDIVVLGRCHRVLAETVEAAIMQLSAGVSHARSRRPLYHIHLSPKGRWNDELLAIYWTAFENEFGFQDQAFVEVVHEKHARRHYHRVYASMAGRVEHLHF
jgi:hypothetical protein